MRIGIHQPNFIPWIGYFYKMLKSDSFVFLDDVQFVRRGYTNRVKIKTPGGEDWLSVPVMKKGRYDQWVSEVQLEPDASWKRKILGTLNACYAKAPYFKTYFKEIEAIIQDSSDLLIDLNIALIHFLAKSFEIDTAFNRSSKLTGVTGQSTERLVSICKSMGASEYLSGFGGQNYQEQEIFEQHSIRLIVYDFKHPEYKQLWGEFIPGLSSVDLLFNCGPQSGEILRNIGLTRKHD